MDVYQVFIIELILPLSCRSDKQAPPLYLTRFHQYTQSQYDYLSQ